MKIRINEKNRERISIAQRLGQPDRVPIDLSMGDQFNYFHGWLKLDGRRYFLDPAYMMDAQVKFINRFNVEGALGPKFGVAIEPSFFGAKVIVPKDTSPWVEANLDTVNKLELFLRLYKEPDPYTAGHFPVLSQCYFFYKQQLGSLVKPPMGLIGPFDTAASLLGSTNIFLWIKDHPDLIHDLLEKITAFFIKHLGVRYELFEPSDRSLHLSDDLCGFLSKEDFIEFEFPYLKKIYDAYCDEESIRQFHCDGPLSHIVDLIPEISINSLISFDPTIDIAMLKKKVGDRVCLKGNIHPIDFIRFSNPQSIRKEVQRLMNAAKKNGGYIMCTGGELADGTPDENIEALISATKEYGTY